jgi:hypothetical protein
MKQKTNRVFARIGARELTPEEIAKVSGGVNALSATTNVATALLVGKPDTPEHDDI